MIPVKIAERRFEIGGSHRQRGMADIGAAGDRRMRVENNPKESYAGARRAADEDGSEGHLAVRASVSPTRNQPVIETRAAPANGATMLTWWS
jgi:hypothetical protein